MKKFLCLILMLCMALIPSVAYADVRIIENPGDPSKTIYVFDFPEQTRLTFLYGEDIKDSDSRPEPPIFYNGKRLKGKYTYPNFDSTKLGPFELKWVFTPENEDIGPITGTVNAIVVLRTWGTIRDEDDIDTIPELMEDSITLQVGTSYTPQILNNVPDSEYTWKTSDKAIVTVNKKTGKLKAVNPGTATITCKMVTPYDEIFTLTMQVTVPEVFRVNNHIQLAKGEKYMLPNPYDVTEYTIFYKSGKSSIVYVDAYTGEVTARKAGQTYIIRTVIDKDYNILVDRFEIDVVNK